MENLSIIIAKSSALLGIFLVGFYFIKYDHNFKLIRNFLAGGIITSAILPFIYFTQIVKVSPSPVNISYSEMPVQILKEVQQQELSVWEILSLIYLLGVLYMFFRFIIQLISIFSLIKSAKKSNQNGIILAETNREISPFSFLNHIIFNPKLHSKKDLDIIICHEKIHIQEFHSVDMILSNINLIAQWFNPFAWIYHHHLQQNLEFLADQNAINNVESREAYQKALVQISVRNFSPGLTNNFYQSLIKKRIVMLNKKIITKRNGWKVHLMFPVIMLFMMFFNVKTKTVYAENLENNISSSPELLQEQLNTQEVEISVGISKTSTPESLKRLKKIFGKRDIELDFEDLEYNPEGILTKLTLRYNNKKTGADGIYSTQKNIGINDFEIYLDKKNHFGFRDIKKVITGTGTTNVDEGISLQKLGKNPLYIINGKTYKAIELYGKTVSTPEQINVLIPEYAIKQYGDVANEGAIIVENAKILNDFSEALKGVDEKNPEFERSFIEIKANSKPQLMHISTSKTTSSKKVSKIGKPDKTISKVSLSSVEFETDTPSENAEQVNTAKNMGYPLIFVDGKMQKKDFKFENLNPEDIARISVVSGDDPLKTYGKKAKDGLVLITTKKSGNKWSLYVAGKGVQVLEAINTKKADTSNWAERTVGNQDYNPAGNPTTYISGEVKIVDTNTANSVGIGVISKDSKTTEKNYSMVRVDSAVNASNIPNSTKIYNQSDNNPPLVVIDGKLKNKDFDRKTINPDTIESINVLKGKSAIDKYGKKGENGVIEITIKK